MITVLGATGNVGSKIATQLLAQNQKVRVVGRDGKKLAGQFKGAEIAQGDITDVAFLTEALRGSKSAFVLIPPDYAAESFGAHYKKVSGAIAAAIKQSGVKYIVNLSSLGADLDDKTGPIKYLKPHEQLLNQLEDVNVKHLRPAYFFENLLANLPLIQAQSIMGSHTAADIKMPMISTADIAGAAVDLLITPAFTGKSVRELLGPQDLTMNEVAAIVSEKAGKPVKYVAFDGASTVQALVGAGLSKDTAELFVEMSAATNTGLIKAHRSGEKATPTKFSDFAEVFKSAAG